MNDAEYLAQKKRVQGFVSKWTNMLGLRTWQKIDIEYFREEALPPRDSETDRGPSRAVADVQTHWQYRTAHVRVCLPGIANETDENAEYIIVHELCHILVNEMREQEDWLKHEEHVVTQLAMAFGWVEKITERETKKKRELPK